MVTPIWERSVGFLGGENRPRESDSGGPWIQALSRGYSRAGYLSILLERTEITANLPLRSLTSSCAACRFTGEPWSAEGEVSSMTYTFMSMDEYLKAYQEDSSLVGPSPGGAAAVMKCSRQYITQLENEGKIDVVRVYQKGRFWGKELIVLMVTGKSLQRYLKERFPETYDPKHSDYKPAAKSSS